MYSCTICHVSSIMVSLTDLSSQRGPSRNYLEFRYSLKEELFNVGAHINRQSVINSDYRQSGVSLPLH
jgi:hypothetical protein